METTKGDYRLRNEEKNVQPTGIMTNVKKHHERNKLWVVSEVWLYLNTVEEDTSVIRQQSPVSWSFWCLLQDRVPLVSWEVNMAGVKIGRCKRWTNERDLIVSANVFVLVCYCGSSP